MSRQRRPSRSPPRREGESDRRAGGTKSDQGELPLLDEINELIEKERTVLNLKLIAQKAETDEWKAKYDMLADKLDAGISGDVQTAEDAADIEEYGAEGHSSAGKQNISQQDVLRVISERRHSWLIDFSHLSFDRILLAKVCKALFGPKTSFPEIHVAVFRDCSFTDDYSAVVAQLARSLPVWALDLSQNDLGETTLAQIISVLKASLVLDSALRRTRRCMCVCIP